MRLRSASGMHFGYLFLDCTSSQGNWQRLDWSLITQLPFYIHPLYSVACFLSHARPRRNARSVNNYYYYYYYYYYCYYYYYYDYYHYYY